MTVIDCILNGLEAELALERELGVRFVECARDLVTVVPAAPTTRANTPSSQAAPVAKMPDKPILREAKPSQKESPATVSPRTYDFVFLHDKMLSGGGVSMMAKIVVAMGRTSETAPIVINGDLPKAKAYVVLGSNALKKWFPGVHASPGQWITDSRAANVLVSYSPEYILRFAAGSAAVKAIKSGMWTSLKGVLTRIAL